MRTREKWILWRYPWYVVRPAGVGVEAEDRPSRRGTNLLGRLAGSSGRNASSESCSLSCSIVWTCRQVERAESRLYKKMREMDEIKGGPISMAKGLSRQRQTDDVSMD